MANISSRIFQRQFGKFESAFGASCYHLEEVSSKIRQLGEFSETFQSGAKLVGSFISAWWSSGDWNMPGL